MGKRKPGKAKTKVVLSLAEFTQGVEGAGKDEDIAALPTAPKPVEQWEAEGGRPEYNSRGYKERSSSHRERSHDADVEFEDRDWTRRGPLEERQGSSFGGGAERDWGGIRRGPLEAEEEAATPERDWEGIRRGPVESSFQSSSVERDWSARKGPIEAEAASGRTISDDQWSSARHAPVEAEFAEKKGEQDWSVRRPIEAESGTPAPESSDWTARKGPVEAEFAAPTPERDWTARKGPIEAGVQKEAPETNWAGVRRRPVEASFSQEQPEVDWMARKGPIDTEVEKAGKAIRDIDFADTRGSKLQALEENKELKQDPVKKEARDNWRRDIPKDTEHKTRHSGSSIPNSSSQEQISSQKERDWGSARRRSHPVEARLSSPRRDAPKKIAQYEEADAPVNNEDRDEAEQADGESDWTTVRSHQRRPTGSNRRHSGKGFSRKGSRPFGRDYANEGTSRTDFSSKGDDGSRGPPPMASATDA